LTDRRKTTVEDLFSRLNARQFGTLGELLDDDAVFDVAYMPDNSSFPNPVRGATAVQDLFETGVASMFKPLDFEILETYLGENPDVIVVEYSSSGVAARTGRPYSNRYVGIFKVRDGRIAQWREYHNPERMVEAFGSPSGSG
jgi:ketosteroid isomerase-like protein